MLVLATVCNHAFGGVYSDNFTLPNSPSEQGAALLKAHDPRQGGQGGQLVFTVSGGTLSADRGAIDSAIANVGRTAHVLAVSNPFTAGTVSANGRTAVATVHFDTNPQQLGHSYVGQIAADVALARSAGVAVNYGGALGQAASPRGRAGASSLVGIVIALLVLLVGLGSVYAAGLPLLTAGLATLTGIGVLGIVAAAAPFPKVSPTFATMIGLGVGIDYTLFLSTRYRQRLIDGASPLDAVGQAFATSGRAVLVAAATVVVALLSLYVSGISFMGRLGVSGAVAVVVGALAALTLVPALLGLIGARIDRHQVRAPAAESTADSPGWGRYARRVGAHPLRFLIGGVALLCVLAIPLHSLRLGHVDAGASPANDTARRAYDEITAAFGAGANGPYTIAVSLPSGISSAAVQTLETKLDHALSTTPDVARIRPVHPNSRGSVLVATVLPRSSPQAQATDTLQTTLRDTTLPKALAGTGAKGYVTGSTSEQLDFRNQLTSRLPLIIAVVVAIAFLLLLVTFRSPVLALKAALLNLLSTGAAYGVIVAVFQWGWGSSLLGVSEKVPIESYVPMLMFAIVFGLSMDYEVFLLSRVREAWLRTGDNHASVAAGLSATARVITCAALIMTGVFLAFMLSTNIVIKMLALGLGASILIDATVIRLVVVPAAMFLLGTYNWWTPRWLDRLLPGGAPGPPTRKDGAGAGPPESDRGAMSDRGGAHPRPGRPHRPNRGRPATLAAAVLGVAVLAAFAVTFATAGGASSQTKKSAKRSGAITVTVATATVKRASLTTRLALAGTVGGPDGAAEITPLTAGTVASLTVSTGQHVSAGQTVAELSPTEPAGRTVTQVPVTAPVAGTIAQILVPVGGYAAPGSPVATLTGSPTTVTAQASPSQTATLAGHTGARATASPAFPGSVGCAATLTRIAPSANPSTQQTAVTFTTRTALTPGAPVSVSVEVPASRGPVVPSDAIVDSGGRQGVYVVTDVLSPAAMGIKLPAGAPAGVEVGKATFTPVRTGISAHGPTEILSGISAGARVVTTGQSDLTTVSKSQRVAILPNGTSKPPPTTATRHRGAASGSAATRAATPIGLTVVAVHGRALTVSTPIGQKRITVPSGFHITHDGRQVTLSQLHPGDVLKVTLARVNGKLTPTSAALQ